MDSSVLILQLTDLHIRSESGRTMAGIDTEHNFREILKYAHTKHEKIDLILVTGDIAEDPCQSSYQRVYEELEKYQIQTLCLPGNHDDFTLMQQFISGNQVNCIKHIQFNDWQVICLNSQKIGSQGGVLSPKEFVFLKDTLNKHANLNTVLAVHHHPLPTKSYWMDTMEIENSDELFTLLRDYPQVKTIICGHIHQDLEIEKEGKLILGTPSTCFQFKPLCKDYTLDDKEPGYRILELFPKGNFKSQIYRVPDNLINKQIKT